MSKDWFQFGSKWYSTLRNMLLHVCIIHYGYYVYSQWILFSNKNGIIGWFRQYKLFIEFIRFKIYNKNSYANYNENIVIYWTINRYNKYYV